MALLLDLLLPVPFDIRYITRLLEAGELIITVFERCRYLLPVWSYGRLNFSQSCRIWGQNARNPDEKGCPFSVS